MVSYLGKKGHQSVLISTVQKKKKIYIYIGREKKIKQMSYLENRGEKYNRDTL